jgi:hypothetical protein
LRAFVLLAALFLMLTWSLPAAPVAAEPVQGHLPVWKEGFAWSYEVDHDVDYDIGGLIQVNHIEENWTRTVYKVLDVGGEKMYKVWESRRGKLEGTVEYGFPISVEADAFGSGFTMIRASDMAIVNESFNLTFSGDLPFGLGMFTGGFDNTTTYDPPLPMLSFPIPSSQWRVRSTINTSTEFFILSPQPYSEWYNTSEVLDLNVTATGPDPLTVPAGTYDSFYVQETGTRSNTTDSWPISRKWYYADEALNTVRTFEEHELVWTDAVYTPPNSPPTGPASTIELDTDEDTPIEIDLSSHFTDPDEDELSFNLALMGPSAVNASLSGTGAVRTLTPEGNWSGDLELQANATDPFGQSATGRFLVRVAPVNDPPHVVWEPFDLAIDEDTTFWAAHDLAAVFDDVDGDTLSLSANSTAGVLAFMNGTAVDLVPENDWTGRATITLTAEDPAGLTVETTFQLMVGEVNDAPSIVDSGGPARIHEASEGTFWVEVVDTDSTELDYAWTVEGAVAIGVSGPSFTYVPGDLTVASVVVRVVVSDDWNDQAEATWEVAILDSPVIVSSGPPSPVTAEVGDTVEFLIEVEDADTEDPSIRWTWNGDLVGTGEELPLMFGTRDVGEGHLLVVVDDGVGNDSVEWTVTVTVPNLPPTVSIRSDSDGDHIEEGTTLTLLAEVEDEDVENLTVRWSVDGSPAGSGLEFTYSAPGSRVGDSVVFQVSVDDGEHRVTDTVSFDLISQKDPTNGPGPEFPWGTVFAIAVVLIVVGILAVTAYLRTRPGRQG